MEPRKLNMAFYDASDGPRIMLLGPLEADFSSLQELFRRLSQHAGPFELHCLPVINAFGDVRVTASCYGSMPEPQGKRPGLRQINSANGKHFDWVRTSEEWDDLAGLIDSLVKSHEPGHHYLSNYPTDDVIFVVSRGEYGDDVRERLMED